MARERKVRIMDVSPEVATRWLEMNTHNRELREHVVAQYAIAMKQGLWRLTPEPIAFCYPWKDNLGKQHPETLIEGQHRLWAIIQSGVTVKCTVWWGCHPDEFHVIGQGIGRTQGDVLQITRRDIKNPTVVASVIGSLMTWGFAKNSKVMTWETELILEHFQDEMEVVAGYKRRLAKLLCRPSVAALALSALIDGPKTAAIVERLNSAIGFTERDPIRSLHIYLHRLQAKDGPRESPEEICYKTLHACLAEIDGRSLQRLQPLIDFLGDARRRLKPRIEPVVRQLHGGTLPSKFYEPRNTLHTGKLAAEAA